MLRVLNPGPQTTLQGAPRTGFRHMGVPWSGPADDWSMALANRLVGNPAAETALEISYGLFEVVFVRDTWFALTGAECAVFLGDEPAAFHQTCFAPAGSVLKLAGAKVGMRTYLAIAGGIDAGNFLGSTSTYMPAGFGGHEGRALKAGDELEIGKQPRQLDILQTPVPLRPQLSNSYALRCVRSAETDLLAPKSETALFAQSFTIGRQATRMGVSLEGEALELTSDGKMKSAAVFPGTIQCPEDGTPIILLADAQTTGGYPRIGHIARCDRHMLGQLRPGDRLRLLKPSPDEAAADLKAKQALQCSWVPDYRA